MRAEAQRREPWPVALAALLLFMIGGSLGFLRVATSHPDPVVAQEASRELPEPVRAARRAAQLGWQIALEAAPHDAGTAGVRVALRDALGAPLAADRVTLRRERPAEGGLDGEVALVADGAEWTGAIALPRTGRWRLIVRAERGGEAAERSFALWLDAAARRTP
jgi:nitrogen fixation protein FixH